MSSSKQYFCQKNLFLIFEFVMTGDFAMKKVWKSSISSVKQDTFVKWSMQWQLNPLWKRLMSDICNVYECRNILHDFGIIEWNVNVQKVKLSPVTVLMYMWTIKSISQSLFSIPLVRKWVGLYYRASNLRKSKLGQMNLRHLRVIILQPPKAPVGVF